MNHSAADIIAAARMQVHERHPYLSTVLFALRPYEANGLNTLAVDEGWRLYYDPVAVERWEKERIHGRLNKIAGSNDWHDGVASVIFHELGHVMRQHFERRGGRDPELANAAMDREINDDVADAGWRLPGKCLMPADVGMANGLTFEEYYEAELHYTGSSCGSIDGPGSGGACGGCAGNPTEWEREIKSKETSRSGFSPGGAETASVCSSAPPSPASDLEQQIALRKTALDIQEYAKLKGRGCVPLGLQAWAETQLMPPKVDWRKKLAGVTRQALASRAGACDFTWRKSGRRSLYASGRSGWPLAPALHQPVPRVAIVLDTSGSMSGLFDEALSEIVGIVRGAGGDAWGVACDADAHSLVRLHSPSDLKGLNKGGGGTDMRPGFAAASKMKPDVVVIVTDGIVGGGWPDEESCRRRRVLAAVVGDSGSVPPYITEVRIEG